MDRQAKTIAPQRATSSPWLVSEPVANCKLKSCRRAFEPKRKDQVFCSPKCKVEYTRQAYEAGVKQMNRKGMRYAHIERSPRLQRILHVLNGNGALTTLEIQNRAKVCCVGTSISELRKQGFNISCKKNGQGNYEYRLEEIRE